MTSDIWDFWAKRYNKLWVQKYSLRPSIEYLLETELEGKNLKILDLGSGPGELIEELYKKNADLNIAAIDFSEEMINISKDIKPNFLI